MPDYLFTEDKKYWRPLCLNEVMPEQDIGPCRACVYPVKMPPVYKCHGCTNVNRPAGYPAAMNLRLHSALGAHAVPSTLLSKTESGSKSGSYTHPLYVINPATGTKTTYIDLEANRTHPDVPTGLNYQVKHLASYLTKGTAPECTWTSIANMKMPWSIWNNDVVTLDPYPPNPNWRQYSIQYLSNPPARAWKQRFYVVHPFSEQSGEVQMADSNLDDNLYVLNDINNRNIVYIDGFRSVPRTSEALVNGLDPRFLMGHPSNAVPGNRNLDPIEPYPETYAHAYYLASAKLCGYFWVVHPRWSVSLYVRPGLCSNIGNFTNPQPVFGQASIFGSNDTTIVNYTTQFYPNYYSTIFGYTYPNNTVSLNYPESYQEGKFKIKDRITPDVFSVLPGMSKFGIFDIWPFFGPYGLGQFNGLIAQWSRNVACSEEGEVELPLTFDYRTRSTTNTGVFGGPSTLPSKVYLDVGDSGL
jgi:hypothetical protein